MFAMGMSPPEMRLMASDQSPSNRIGFDARGEEGSWSWAIRVHLEPLPLPKITL
jgi:hypothetical protein